MLFLGRACWEGRKGKFNDEERRLARLMFLSREKKDDSMIQMKRQPLIGAWSVHPKE